ncbi:MAG: M14 family metallopeptidase [Pseudomonadota bacterium]
MRLRRVTELPARLADIEQHDILSIMPEPTLVSLEGERESPLFLSVLLHGNETTSFAVLQNLAARFQDQRPSRSLMIFIGNVEAAAAGVRVLPGQDDFNRIWAGGDTQAERLATEVIDAARGNRPFASIDIHNNTGSNPHYGCINALRPEDMYLAGAFAQIGVYYNNPCTTQSIAFSKLCPAVTLECGKSGDTEGLERAMALIDQVLALDTFPTQPQDPPELFLTTGRVVIDANASFSFGEAETQLKIRSDIEDLNFRHMDAGEIFAECADHSDAIRVLDEQNCDITSAFFLNDDGLVRLRRRAAISMATRDRAVIRQDCLCYFMHRIEA